MSWREGHKEQPAEVCDRHKGWSEGHTFGPRHQEGRMLASGTEQDRDETVSRLNIAVNEQEMCAFGTRLWPRQRECVLTVSVRRHSKEGIVRDIYNWDRTWWVILFGTWVRPTRHRKGTDWGQQTVWGKGEMPGRGRSGKWNIPSWEDSRRRTPSEQPGCPVPWLSQTPPAAIPEESPGGHGACPDGWNAPVKRIPGAVMHKQQLRTWPSLGGMAVFWVTAPGA